ncbi:hypothetical protein VNO77_42956 [Canavalia gladiata]|uniref:Uncharacterized protein n=1 Tax=Canavalia gladiata TaxID=3824 RepID=A0AAN9PPI2_CANGL
MSRESNNPGSYIYYAKESRGVTQFDSHRVLRTLVYFCVSLKRRKCDNEKHNFMERLLGAARLLAEMVEPILKAASYPSATGVM